MATLAAAAVPTSHFNPHYFPHALSWRGAYLELSNDSENDVSMANANGIISKEWFDDASSLGPINLLRVAITTTTPFFHLLCIRSIY